VLESCGDTRAGLGSTRSPQIHQTRQMARVAELVKSEDDTAVGAINEDARERSVELSVQVGLLSEPVAYDDVVDESVYEAVAE
jgi:hypothetical protein